MAKSMTKEKTKALKQKLRELLKDYWASEVMCELISAVENTDESDDLKDEAISFVTIHHGCSVVQLDNLSDKMAFEDFTDKLIPYHNQQQKQLFLPC